MVPRFSCILYGNVLAFIMLEFPAFHLIDFHLFVHCQSRRNKAPAFLYHVISHFICILGGLLLLWLCGFYFLFPSPLPTVINPNLKLFSGCFHWLIFLSFCCCCHFDIYIPTPILLYYFPAGKAAQNTCTMTAPLIYLTSLTYLMCSFLLLKDFSLS